MNAARARKPLYAITQYTEKNSQNETPDKPRPEQEPSPSRLPTLPRKRTQIHEWQERHYFICGEQLKRPTAITHTSTISRKRREKRTCHYSIHGEGNSPIRREQPRRKHKEEPPQEEQNHIRRQREQTAHFTQRNTRRIERYRGEGLHIHRRENP